MHLNTACLLQYAHVHFVLVKPTSDYYYYYLLLLIGIHWKCSFFELYYVVQSCSPPSQHARGHELFDRLTGLCALLLIWLHLVTFLVISVCPSSQNDNLFDYCMT